jgi:hypothetical protein
LLRGERVAERSRAFELKKEDDMFKGKIIIASLSLTLLLSTGAFAQRKGNRTSAKQKANAISKRKAGKYANQEVSYRQTKSERLSTGNQPNQLLPYVEQDHLKTAKPKQQNLLPYMEQSNLRTRRHNSKRR